MTRRELASWIGMVLIGAVIGLATAVGVANSLGISGAPPDDSPTSGPAWRPHSIPPGSGSPNDYLEPIGDLLQPAGPVTVARVGRVDAELLVTTVATQPTYSSALVLVGEAQPQVVLVGDRVAGATVEGIDRGSVSLRLDDGSLARLEFGAREPAAARPKESKRPGGKTRIAWNEGITQVDETHYEVTEEALARALENLASLGKEAKVVPNFSDGKIDGFRIFRIRNTGPFDDLGLRNNDVLTSANGQALEPATILETATALQGEGALTLQVQRGGETVALHYEIH